MKLAIAFFTLSLAVVDAQTPARDPAALATAPSGTGGLSGVVKDEAGHPLRRVTVTITGDMRVTLATITADDGRFGFSNLPAGRFTISAQKPGYPSVSYGANRPNRPGSGVLLTEGQQAVGINLTLARGGVLAGTVFDDQGQPLPGVPVMAWEVRTSLAGGRTLDFPSTGGVAVTSDDRGAYRLYGLPPGEYTVGTSWFYSGLFGDVRVPTAAEIQRAFQIVTQPASPALPTPAAANRPAPPPSYNFTRVFHPDSVDPLAAATLRLAAGEEREGIDIRMQFRPMSRIEGVVVGPDGPADRIEMILARRSLVNALNSQTHWSTDPDGRFVTSSLPPGDYTIQAQTQPTAAGGRLWAMADLTVSGAEPIPITLRLEPAMKLTGRFIFEGATPPPPDLTRMRLSMLPTSSSAAMSNNEPAVVEASGSFSMSGLIPGTFRIVANVPPPAAGTPPPWTLRSVTSAGRDVTDLPLTISPGEAPSLVVTFTDQISELSGTLTDAAGRPATDYFVIVFPTDHRYWIGATRRIVNARPDVRGRFVFRGLPPGDYRIAATTDLVARDLSDANALTQLEVQSAPIALTMGEKKVFDIRLGGR